MKLDIVDELLFLMWAVLIVFCMWTDLEAGLLGIIAFQLLFIKDDARKRR